MKNGWKLPVIIGAVIVAFILMIVIGVQSAQNRAISLEESVYTAQSDIKVQEKRRVDLVYNLADCVKQYDKHESATLSQLAVNGNDIKCFGYKGQQIGTVLNYLLDMVMKDILENNKPTLLKRVEELGEV